MNKKPKFNIGDEVYLFAFEGGNNPYLWKTTITGVHRNRDGVYEYMIEQSPFRFYCTYLEKYLFRNKDDVIAFIEDEFTRGYFDGAY